MKIILSNANTLENHIKLNGLNIKFISLILALSFKNLHSSKNSGIIGIYDRSINDLSNLENDFNRFKKVNFVFFLLFLNCLLFKKVMDEKVNVYRILILNAPENENTKNDQDPFMILVPNFTSQVFSILLNEKRKYHDFFFKEKFEEFIDIEIQGMMGSIILHFASEIQKMKFLNNLILRL